MSIEYENTIVTLNDELVIDLGEPANLQNLLKYIRDNCETLLEDERYTFLFEQPRVPGMFLRNESNSCAIDSILSIVFYAGGGYLAQKIFSDDDVNDMKLLISKIYNGNFKLSRNKIQQKLSTDNVAGYKMVTEIYGNLADTFKSIQFLHKNGLRRISTNYIQFSEFKSGIQNDTLKSDHFVVAAETLNASKRQSFRNLLKVRKYELKGFIRRIDQCHFISTFKSHNMWMNYDNMSGQVLGFIPNKDFPAQEGDNDSIVLFFFQQVL